jgi:archaeal flagellin FlaB
MKGHKARKKGMMGIGTLIIFIAVIVVSAVAAAVLIGAGGSLEQRSMTTMKGTEQEVATGLNIYSVIGSDASANGTVQNLELLVRLRPGSDPVNFNSTVITIDGREMFQSMRFANGSAGGGGNYSVYYIRRGGSPLDGYLGPGDSAIINISLVQAIGPDQRIIIQVIPSQGGIKRLDFQTPSVMFDKRVILYP